MADNITSTNLIADNITSNTAANDRIDNTQAAITIIQDFAKLIERESKDYSNEIIEMA